MLFYAVNLFWLYHANTLLFRYSEDFWYLGQSIWLRDWQIALLLLLSPFLHVIRCSFARRSLTFSFVPLPKTFFTEPLISGRNWIGLGVSALLVVLFGVHIWFSFSVLSYKLLAVVFFTITLLWVGLNWRKPSLPANVLYMGILLTLSAGCAVWIYFEADTLREAVVQAYRMALPWLGYTLLYTVLIAVGCVLVRRHRAAAVQKNPLP